MRHSSLFIIGNCACGGYTKRKIVLINQGAVGLNLTIPNPNLQGNGLKSISVYPQSIFLAPKSHTLLTCVIHVDEKPLRFREIILLQAYEGEWKIEVNGIGIQIKMTNYTQNLLSNEVLPSLDPPSSFLSIEIDPPTSSSSAVGKEMGLDSNVTGGAMVRFEEVSKLDIATHISKSSLNITDRSKSIYLLDQPDTTEFQKNR